MSLLIFAVMLFGLAYIAGQSVISLPLRKWLMARSAPIYWWRCSGCGKRWQNAAHVPVASGQTPFALCTSPSCTRAQHDTRPPPPVTDDGEAQWGFKPLAWLVELVECPACLSFHVGWIVDLLRPQVLDIITDHQTAGLSLPLHLLLAALLASGCSAVVGHLTGVMKS